MLPDIGGAAFTLTLEPRWECALGQLGHVQEMFSQLGLSPAICASLARKGYTTPTPVQIQAIPIVLKGVDLLARAQTGTGKTAAFGLPIIERLIKEDRTQSHAPRVLVLVPTRELAVQVNQSLATYGASTKLRVAAIFGGVSMGPQLQTLRRGVDVIVATPGRLIDHMQRGTIDLKSINVLVLDEADRMLDMGFQPALKRILPVLPKQRQTLLFSATLGEEVMRLSKAFTHDAQRVDVSPREVVATTVTHHVLEVSMDRKRDVLTQLLTEDGAGQALVFCRTKRGANRVGEGLGARGLRTSIIHGNKSQGARTRALDDFKAGRTRILVATDIAARGLDIVDMPLVVNFDLPLVAEDYVHRVGRTGRAGQTGRAVSLVTQAEAGLLRDIQRLVSAPLQKMPAPTGTAAPEVRNFEPAPARSERPQHNRPNGAPRRFSGPRRNGRRGRSMYAGV